MITYLKLTAEAILTKIKTQIKTKIHPLRFTLSHCWTHTSTHTQTQWRLLNITVWPLSSGSPASALTADLILPQWQQTTQSHTAMRRDATLCCREMSLVIGFKGHSQQWLVEQKCQSTVISQLCQAEFVCAQLDCRTFLWQAGQMLTSWICDRQGSVVPWGGRTLPAH